MSKVLPVPSPGPGSQCPDSDRLQAAYLALLPVVRSMARARFRHIQCPDRKDDAIAEAAAVGWKWFVGLVARGRNPAEFPVSFARMVARSVACGRRLAGSERVNDILSSACRRRRGFAVVGLPAGAPPNGTDLADALSDNTRTPVDLQAQFRTDFAAWRAGLGNRARFVADQLAVGHGTGEVARMIGVSPPRVAQMRGELRRDFLRFLSGPPTG